MPFISKPLPEGGGGYCHTKAVGVPPEPHGANGEREKSRNLGSLRDNY